MLRRHGGGEAVGSARRGTRGPSCLSGRRCPKEGVGLGANRQRGPPRAGVNPSSVFVSAGARRPGAVGRGRGRGRGGDGDAGRGEGARAPPGREVTELVGAVQGGWRGGRRILRRSRVRTSSSRQPPKAAAGRSTTSAESSGITERLNGKETSRGRVHGRHNVWTRRPRSTLCASRGNALADVPARPRARGGALERVRRAASASPRVRRRPSAVRDGDGYFHSLDEPSS